jgi:hypothetical protein
MSKQSKRNTQKNIAKKRTKRQQISKEKRKTRVQKLNLVSKQKKRLVHNLMQQLQKMQKQ